MLSITAERIWKVSLELRGNECVDPWNTRPLGEHRGSVWCCPFVERRKLRLGELK